MTRGRGSPAWARHPCPPGGDAALEVVAAARAHDCRLTADGSARCASVRGRVVEAWAAVMRVGLRTSRDLLPLLALAAVWCVLAGAAFAGVTIRSAVRSQDRLLQRASEVSTVLADAGRAEALAAAIGDPKTNPASLDLMRAELADLALRIHNQAVGWNQQLSPGASSALSSAGSSADSAVVSPSGRTATVVAGTAPGTGLGSGTDPEFASVVERVGPLLIDLSLQFSATAGRAAAPDARLAPGQLLRGNLDGDYLVLRAQAVAVHDALRAAAADADRRWSWVVSVVLSVTATVGIAVSWLLLGPIRRRLARQRRDAARAQAAREQALGTVGRVLDCLDVPVLVVDADGSHLDANAAAVAQFGFLDSPRTPVAALPEVLFVSSDGNDVGWDHLPVEHVLRTATAVSTLVSVPSVPGDAKTPDRPAVTRFSVTVHPVTDPDGRVLGAVASFQDITDLHARAEHHARHAAQLATIRQATSAILRQDDARAAVCDAARAVCEAAVALLFEDDGHGDLVCTAAAGADVFGMRLPINGRSMTAMTFAQARPHTANSLDGERDLDRQAVNTLARGCGQPINAGAWIPVTTAGRCRAVLAVAFTDVQPVTEHLPTLEVLAGEAAVALDRQDLIRRLAQDAEIDPLTGAANRRAWDVHLADAVQAAHRNGADLTLVMLDLDHFKTYNDTHGHQAGDALLRQCVNAWRQTIRPEDILARYGGEEFAVLLTSCNSTHAAAVADKLRRAMPAGQTCSAGIATLAAGETPHALLGRADRALYQAKSAGRDRAVLAQA